MSCSVEELVVRAEAAMSGLGHAPSTRSQYRWAWSQFDMFCFREGFTEPSEEAVASFLRFVAEEHREGRLTEWKRKLLRKAVLVLSEVATTGAYEWRLSREAHANDAFSVVLRPVQEQFEAWLEDQRLATATRRNLYATVSRTVLAWLPGRGVTGVRRLSGADVSAAVVFLGGRYQPTSMRTVLSAVRVWTRFLEDVVGCAGLSRAVPTLSSRRACSARVLTADRVDELTRTPDPATPAGRRVGVVAERSFGSLAIRAGFQLRNRRATARWKAKIPIPVCSRSAVNREVNGRGERI